MLAPQTARTKGKTLHTGKDEVMRLIYRRHGTLDGIRRIRTTVVGIRRGDRIAGAERAGVVNGTPPGVTRHDGHPTRDAKVSDRLKRIVVSVSNLVVVVTHVVLWERPESHAKLLRRAEPGWNRGSGLLQRRLAVES